jgi:hypothetical protein
MPRHRRLIVRDQNASVACGERKNFLIAQSREAGGRGGSKINGRYPFTTADTMTWFRSASAWNRIGIQRVSGVFFFASVSFW